MKKDELLLNRKSGWDTLNKKEMKTLDGYTNEYIDFLNECKTERECVKYVEKLAKKQGFKELDKCKTLKPGDKVYYINRDKNILLAVIGNEQLEKGINLIGSHIDSPRIDLKPNPLYESEGFALFKTHYYGGIKKYQWVTIPLEIRGVIIKTNGEKVEISIGKDKDDPIFVITDLLPHLARRQMEKKLSEGIEGEDLNILVGNIPSEDKEANEKVKYNILKILNEKYGITEADFISSELELVPNFEAKLVGFDKSMIAGYGQDDRVCSFASAKAIMDLTEIPNKTCVAMLMDKEEIGSMGNTGMCSNTLDFMLMEMAVKLKQESYNLLNKLYINTKMLSSDVDAAFDPTFAGVSDPKNSSFIGKGICLLKYTGARGKSGSSEACAEYVAYVRKIFEDNNVRYQSGELGKVDEGGGGTIAYIVADKGADVIDCGVPVLSMHSPYEVTSKHDCYMAYKGYKEFLKK
ncbi:MAG: aminopeptidase [Clostridiales bacterium]|nr:aminopeptidase [Clostridiales bacterium]